MVRFLMLLLCLSTASVYASDPIVYTHELYAKTTIKNLKTHQDSLNFLVVGDWGRNGHYHQQSVAHWMEIAMHHLDGDFIVSTGDNFYPNGVASVNDPYWQSSYEAIYQGPNSFAPWYVVLGNHDYRGNPQAQIDYTQVSQRWNMPSPYYSKTFSIDEDSDQKTDLLVLFIDTSPLVPEYQNETKYRATVAQDAATQLQWIKTQLAGSTAKWKLVVGHHPLYTSGKRYGRPNGIRDILQPIFEEHGVHAYFAGHEHDLQYNQPEGTTVAHFISGAGSEIRPVQQRKFTRYAESQAGFLAVTVTDNTLLVQMINDEGNVRYQHQIKP